MTDVPECQECGEKRKDRLTPHPDYPGDRLCVDCCINWHEEQVDEHKAELDKLYPEQRKFDAADKLQLQKRKKT